MLLLSNVSVYPRTVGHAVLMCRENVVQSSYESKIFSGRRAWLLTITVYAHAPWVASNSAYLRLGYIVKLVASKNEQHILTSWRPLQIHLQQEVSGWLQYHTLCS